MYIGVYIYTHDTVNVDVYIYNNKVSLRIAY